MNVFVPQFGKVNTAVLPLRFGITITQTHQCFATLEDATVCEESTRRQRDDEKNDKGRKVFTGTLVINREDKNDAPYRCIGKFVVEPPPPLKDRDRIITALRQDFEELKNDIATSRHLEGMLKHNRITTKEIIDILHPAFLAGRIKESNDIEKILEDEIKPGRPTPNAPKSQSDGGIMESGSEIIDATDDIDIDDDENIKPLVFKELNLKPSIKFSYVMADAHILDAGSSDGFIWVSLINSKGVEQELKSFSVREHLSHHHERVLEYFLSRRGQRAFLAICVSEKYKGILAESVTSIALDLMKNKR